MELMQPMPLELALRIPTIPETSTATVAQTISTAASTVVTAVAKGQRNNNPHRVINVHGLMYDEAVINDVWINAILSTLALSCAACVCLCFLYCKIQQWKHEAEQRRRAKIGSNYDDESLPSYTIVTGLPSYDEAVEWMRKSNSSPSKYNTASGLFKQTAISVVKLQDETSAITIPGKPMTYPSSSPMPPPISTLSSSTMRFKLHRSEQQQTPPMQPVTISASVASSPPHFGLVSHGYYMQHRTCSHCLSVQELLETYNVR
ncbi:protein commissureless 2-like [Daktulosphaira vitifoliae]|uniref:protein commissureless 2-like n=1 Tax=Daktulosphaira vitifoliae TaxID=58002 RepID=UPI0021AA8BBA|nr:protein commissureless 2-like [Daktulosphaira vitifoliae]XP_050529185.1 protein commissureless 2-like [Daktulosphaira vitifoliae]